MAKRLDDTTRAAAIAALLAGQSVNEVARQYKLSKSTVSALKQSAGAVAQAAFEPKNGEPSLGERIAAVLGDLLTTVQVQASVARDEAWIKRQNAADLAVFLGVCADKAVRILEAVEPADSSGDSIAGA